MHGVELQEWHASQDERLRRSEIRRTAILLGVLSIGLSVAMVVMAMTGQAELALLLESD